MKKFELWALLEKFGETEKWQRIETFRGLDAALTECFTYVRNAPANNICQWQIVSVQDNLNIVVFSCTVKKEEEL